MSLWTKLFGGPTKTLFTSAMYKPRYSTEGALRYHTEFTLVITGDPCKGWIRCVGYGASEETQEVLNNEWVIYILMNDAQRAKLRDALTAAGYPPDFIAKETK